MSTKAFGKKPTGERLKRIEQSENYRDNSFQNLSPTEVTASGVSYFKMIREFLSKPSNTEPSKPLPSVKTNLTLLKGDTPQLVWFGHSSYLIVYKGKRILVDPVFSGNASPTSLFGKSFAGSDVFKVDDLPDIDVLIITHDHYDHLDYKTILALAPKVKKIVTSLGVGSHLEYWGISPKIIHELDWWENVELEKGIEVIGTPARHFSGRGVSRGKTLWSSFVLHFFDTSIYIGGDSGYDSHFKAIGQKFGPFELAILETGQYNESWPLIHMMPEQAVQAAVDLDAKAMMPVHWAKFSLALHPWQEPAERTVTEAHKHEMPIATPMIGEVLQLGGFYDPVKWWNYEKS